MAPQIALFACLFFISITLYFENRYLSQNGLVIWIIVLWLLHSTSKQLGNWFQISTTIEAGSLPDRLFLLLLAIIALIILFRRHFRWIDTIKKNYILLLVLLYIFLSITWSKVPGISLRRAGREWLGFLIGCVLVSENKPLDTLVRAFKNTIYIFLPISILLIKYYPYYGREYNRWTGELMWIGITNQKNVLGKFCAFSALFLIWSIFKNLLRTRSRNAILTIFIDSFMLILCIYLMMGPKKTIRYSVTSFISLLVGLLILISLIPAIGIKPRFLKSLRIVVIVIILMGIFLPFSGNIKPYKIPKFFDRDDTLTGRTKVWKILVDNASKKIILGHGYGGFWTTSLREEIAPHAHNGYLDTILDLGIIGLILLIGFFLRILTISINLKYKNDYIHEFDILLLFIPFIIMFFIHNISESSLGRFTSFPTSLILLYSFAINEYQEDEF